ncbi:early endosome antigen 1-like isoform X2 [Denticeps clupeoides]|uniref:early endosome antigen 1-like isoform X2 n=1 Tax=Denticeps clupeoides TaxID=299321 RepID=UPI0010A55E58|nr:early endosome antigen 1-like isoform X2 [Denticeps clupeoides]
MNPTHWVSASRAGTESLQCPVKKSIKALLEEFKGLYNERLRGLELGSHAASQEEELQVHKVKVKILQSYVNDLCDQNQVLVQAVEDLRREANDKVSFLERKLQASDKTVSDLDHQRRCLEESAARLQAEIQGLKADAATLTQIIKTGRHTFGLDVAGVNLRTVSLEKVKEPLRPSEHLCKPEDVMKAQAHDLASHLMAKSGIMRNLEEEIKALLYESALKKNKTSDLRQPSDVLGNVWQSTDRDVTLVGLCAELEVAQWDAVDMQNKVTVGHRAEKEAEIWTLTAEGQLGGHNKTMREAMCSLQHKLQTSEEKVNSLGLEVGLLKSKLQEKTEQSQQLQDQILKQQEALSRASETLKDTRKAAGNKLLRRDDSLQKLREEAAELTAQITQRSQDIRELSSQNTKLEMELTFIKEKHRTAQQEVSSRDRLMLQLKAALRATQEKHQGALEELTALEAEISRLNESLRRLQTQLHEAETSRRHGDLQLQREQQDKQQLQSQLNSIQLKMGTQSDSLQLLQRDLAAAKQKHSADTAHRSHEASLLQTQLHQTRARLRQAAAQARERRAGVRELRSKTRLTEARHQEALLKVEEDKELIQRQHAFLKQKLEAAQSSMENLMTVVQKQESTTAIFKHKYTAAMEKVQQLQACIDGLKEDAQYSNKQLIEAQELLEAARAEIASWESRYEEKCKQMVCLEEVVDQLTEELQAALAGLQSSRGRVSECEHMMEKLVEKLDGHQEKMLDCEKRFLQLQSHFASYQSRHSHSNEDHKALQRQCDLYQKEVAMLRQQCGETEDILAQLCAEAEDLRADLHMETQEKQNLDRTLRSLHLEAASTQQGHGACMVQLEQELSRLRDELSLSLSACAQKDKVIQERDDLLQRTDADLLQAQEAIGGLALEVEVLREEAHNAVQEKSHLQQESAAARARIGQLELQLRDARALHRETAQALAGGEERVSELESGLKAAEGELAERVAQSVRLERSCQRSRHQLAELEQMVERLQEEATAAQSSLQQALQETVQQHRLQHTHNQQVGKYEENVFQVEKQPEQSVGLWQEHVKELANKEVRLERSPDEPRQLTRVLEGAHAGNTHLRQESQLLLASVSRWIKEQNRLEESRGAVAAAAVPKTACVVADEGRRGGMCLKVGHARPL